MLKLEWRKLMIKLNDFSLDDFVKFADYLQQLLQEDTFIIVIDSEKTLFVRQGDKMRLPIKEGDKINPAWSTVQCMQKKEMINIVVPKEVLGVTYRSVANPICDKNGKILGAVAIIRNIGIVDDLTATAKSISNTLSELAQSTSQMAINANELVNSHEKINESNHETSANMQQTDVILNFIDEIADQSNILGINAAIEAARAGEKAQGFNVVATEIRKLSVNSNSSVTKAKKILGKVKESIEVVTTEIEKNNKIIENQAAFIEELNATIEELNGVAENLYNLSKTL